MMLSTGNAQDRPKYQIHQLAQLNPRDTCQLREIYETSFPAYQQMDFSLLLEAIESGARSLYTMKTGDELLGFAVTLSLPQTEVILLEYLAVRGESRSQGLGSILLRSVLHSARQAKRTTGILLEVEAGDDGTALDKALRLRRIQFYERNGANLVECAASYRSPNKVCPDGMPMHLMWIPLTPSRSAISGELLKTCITGIYTKSYHTPADDPLLKAVLGEIDCS